MAYGLFLSRRHTLKTRKSIQVYIPPDRFPSVDKGRPSKKVHPRVLLMYRLRYD